MLSPEYKARIKRMIAEELRKRNIDIEEIRNKYISGMDIYRIKIIYKLTEEQTDYILKNMITKEDDDMRKRNREKFEEIRIPLGIPDHSDRKDLFYGRTRNKEMEECEYEL